MKKNFQRRRQALEETDDSGQNSVKRAAPESDSDEATQASRQRSSKSARLDQKDDRAIENVSQHAGMDVAEPSDTTMKSKTTIQQPPLHQSSENRTVTKHEEQLKKSAEVRRTPSAWRENTRGRTLRAGDILTREDLRPGDIIWAPWHVTALMNEGIKVQRKWRKALKPAAHDGNDADNESTIAQGGALPKGDTLRRPARDDPEDKGPRPLDMKDFVQSKCAVLCSKRRMLCVHYVHEAKALQAFPMFTHKGRGLEVLRKEVRKYRIPVKDKGDESWQNPLASHKAVELEQGSKDCQMRGCTILDYTTSYPIDLSELIEKVGIMSKEGFEYIVEQHEGLQKDSPSAGDQKPTSPGAEEAQEHRADTRATFSYAKIVARAPKQ